MALWDSREIWSFVAILPDCTFPLICATSWLLQPSPPVSCFERVHRLQLEYSCDVIYDRILNGLESFVSNEATYVCSLFRGCELSTEDSRNLLITLHTFGNSTAEYASISTASEPCPNSTMLSVLNGVAHSFTKSDQNILRVQLSCKSTISTSTRVNSMTLSNRSHKFLIPSTGLPNNNLLSVAKISYLSDLLFDLKAKENFTYACFVITSFISYLITLDHSRWNYVRRNLAGLTSALNSKEQNKCS